MEEIPGKARTPPVRRDCARAQRRRARRWRRRRRWRSAEPGASPGPHDDPGLSLLVDLPGERAFEAGEEEGDIIARSSRPAAQENASIPPPRPSCARQYAVRSTQYAVPSYPRSGTPPYVRVRDRQKTDDVNNSFLSQHLGQSAPGRRCRRLVGFIRFGLGRVACAGVWRPHKDV